MRTTLLLAAAAALLAGCTISTELDPRGFQYWRQHSGSITGSNLPRRDGDETKVRGMETADVEKIQRNTPVQRSN